MFRNLTRTTARIAVAAAVATAGLGAAGPARAASEVADVPCSAAALINSMNSASSGQTLSLASGCVYRLTAGLPVVSEDLVITGNGATLERSLLPGTPAFTILEVDVGTVAISGLSFRNGRGAIAVNDIGNVTVEGGTFVGNTAAEGGAIDDNSALAGLAVNDATFIRNTAVYGGAIFDFSSVGATITDSAFFGNRAVDGGAIFADPDVDTFISGVVIHGNSATAGGGIYNVTSVVVTSSQISGNRAVRQGGGLYNAGTEPGTAEVTGTVFLRNTARDGAGIYNDDGIVSIADSAMSGNQASASGGGIYNIGDHRGQVGSVTLTASEIIRNDAGAHGGGIYNNAGQVAAAATRIIRNTAAGGGGIGDNGTATVTLTNSAVLENRPDNCEPAASIAGCAG